MTVASALLLKRWSKKSGTGHRSSLFGSGVFGESPGVLRVVCFFSYHLHTLFRYRVVYEMRLLSNVCSRGL